MLGFGATMLGWFGVGDELAKRIAWVPLALGALAGLFVIYFIATSWMGTVVDTARSAGTTEAVIAGQNQTLEQLGDANDAEEELRAGGERSAVRYNDCLRDSRDKPRCERYNPNTGQ